MNEGFVDADAVKLHRRILAAAEFERTTGHSSDFWSFYICVFWANMAIDDSIAYITL